MKPTYARPRKCPRTLFRFVLGTLLMKLAPGHVLLLNSLDWTNTGISFMFRVKSSIRLKYNPLRMYMLSIPNLVCSV